MSKPLSASELKIQQVDGQRWRIPREGPMRVPGLVFASEALMEKIRRDGSVAQVANVACLPGILKASIAMPDIHQGYGFPIGGVAAMDPDDGVVSPGGVGYDINCGVRMVGTKLNFGETKPRLTQLVEALYAAIPCGVGQGSALGRKLSPKDLRKAMAQGAAWAVEAGFGGEADLDRIEEGGCIPSADPDAVSEVAVKRGAGQLGSLGSGNHFVELDVVDEIYRETEAEAFGLHRGQIVLQVHSGSRGLGYQVCDDQLRTMQGAMKRHAIQVPDRQLACVPIRSNEGRQYLGAMAAAANFAFNNRQIMSAVGLRAIGEVLGRTPREVGGRLIYDVCHNIAKFETHEVDGKARRVLVHRKGATRAFGPGREELVADYRRTGQPVLVPGDMGRASYILVGTDAAMRQTFGSACHGAGRLMSRKRAMREVSRDALAQELRERGVIVRSKGRNTLREEAPAAYKDVSEVAQVLDDATIARRVARLRPIGVVKG